MRISDWSSDVCSSDLPRGNFSVMPRDPARTRRTARCLRRRSGHEPPCRSSPVQGRCHRSASACAALRSEEHTSELQSLMRISYAVFCLKKKNITTPAREQKTQLPKYNQYHTHTLNT